MKQLIRRVRINDRIPTMIHNDMYINEAYYDDIVIVKDVEGGTPVPPEPEPDYNLEYLHVLSWEDNCTFTLKNTKSYTIYYSTDKTTWSSTNSGMTYSLSKGERLYFKGNLTNVPLSNNNNDSSATTFDCDKIFEICGNMCSLFYGDDFVGHTDFNGCYWIRPVNDGCTTILSIRNLILPNTNYSMKYIYRWFCAAAPNLIYGIKELPASTTSFGSWPVTSFYEGCNKIQESPVIRMNTTDLYQMFNGTSLKRLIWLGSSGYPTGYGTVPSGLIRYKLSTNTSSGDFRNFDTLESSNTFISIWAKAETPYSGYIEGCSDYFIAGDTVTLKATPLTGYTFAGYYDGDTLVSSNTTYTFTASESKQLTVKFN